MSMDFKEFEHRVQTWAALRGIYQHSTVHAQVLKAVSEMGELADATIKGDIDEFTDAVGDVMVCLVNACALRGVDMGDAMHDAWLAIKDRKGSMSPDGAWVKEDE